MSVLDRQFIPAVANTNRLARVLIRNVFRVELMKPAWLGMASSFTSKLDSPSKDQFLIFTILSSTKHHKKAAAVVLMRLEHEGLRVIKTVLPASVSFTWTSHKHSACLIPRITTSSFRDSDGSLWQTALFVPDVAGYLSIKPWHLLLAEDGDPAPITVQPVARANRITLTTVSYVIMPNTYELPFPAQHLSNTESFITFLCDGLILAEFTSELCVHLRAACCAYAWNHWRAAESRWLCYVYMSDCLLPSSADKLFGLFN